MSFCNTLEEIAKSCSGNTGGIVSAWINNGAIYDAVTTDATSLVTGVTLLSAVTSFVQFAFNPNTSNYVETSTIDLVNGSTFYNQTITIQLSRREADKRRKLLLLALGQPGLTFVIKDSNGLYWLFGSDDDKVYLTGNEGGSGTAKADLNGYTLTFTCEDAKPVFEIQEATALALIAA